MAKKQAKKKTEGSRDKNRAGIKIFAALIIFTTGVWVGSGGIKYTENGINFQTPDIQRFLSNVREEAPEKPKKPAINKPMLSFFENGYGNCTVSKIISVYDGDTFRCDIEGLPDIIGKNISLRGVDTPEINDKSPYVQTRAIDARDFAKRKLLAAQTVELRNIDRGKYFRILADVYVDDKNLGDMLLEAGLAMEYDGGTKPAWE
jgi:endonuclease YncB( thermonuclease family)